MCVKSFSRVRLFATLWTVACQAPLSMGSTTQEYWSGLPFQIATHLYKVFAILAMESNLDSESKVLFCRTGNDIQYSVINHNGRQGIYVCIIESLCSTAEMNTSL